MCTPLANGQYTDEDQFEAWTCAMRLLVHFWTGGGPLPHPQVRERGLQAVAIFNQAIQVEDNSQYILRELTFHPIYSLRTY